MSPAPEWYAADSDDADRFPEWTLWVDPRYRLAVPDDETPATGHRAADVSDPDARHPLEDTPTYLRRLSTENANLRAENERLTAGIEDIAHLWSAYTMSRDLRALLQRKPPCYCGSRHA